MPPEVRSPVRSVISVCSSANAEKTQPVTSWINFKFCGLTAYSMLTQTYYENQNMLTASVLYNTTSCTLSTSYIWYDMLHINILYLWNFNLQSWKAPNCHPPQYFWLNTQMFSDAVKCHWASSSQHFRSTMALINAGTCPPNDMAQYPRILGYLATLLWQPPVSQLHASFAVSIGLCNIWNI